MTIMLNPDKELVQEILEQRKKNNGYCPCVLPGKQTSCTKCMCEMFKQQSEPGECHCGLYVKV